MKGYRITTSFFWRAHIISTSIQNIPWPELEHRTTPKYKRWWKKSSIFFQVYLSPAKNYVTLDEKSRYGGTTSSFWYNTPVTLWLIHSKWASPYPDALSFSLTYISNQVVFTEHINISYPWSFADFTYLTSHLVNTYLVMSSVIGTRDGKLNKDQSFSQKNLQSKSGEMESQSVLAIGHVECNMW